MATIHDWIAQFIGWLALYVDHPWLLVAAVAVAIPFLWQCWQWFFGDLDGFVSDVKTGAAPDLYSLMRGRYWDDQWAEFKILAFFVLCAGFSIALYKIGIMILY